jgi:type IV pilus biogenesis protein CpaD/CtpE
MSRIKSTVLFVMVVLSLAGCSNPTTKAAAASPDAKAAPDNINQLIDTTKLKSDLNNVLSSLASGKPDTAKLKAAASDILSTDAKVLSDSGIDQLYGNSSDPAVKAAGDALKKMRNSMGITPDKLDSIRKAANQLKN